MKIVAKNNFSNVVSIVKGDIETVELPLDENEKVDIIVSEWMGYGLFYENMLSSVLKAKKYLSSEGLILPNYSSLFIQGMTSSSSLDSTDRLEWWRDIHGFDLSDMNELLTSEAQVQEVDPQDIFTNRIEFHSLDIAEANDSDLDFVRPFSLVRILNLYLSIYII